MITAAPATREPGDLTATEARTLAERIRAGMGEVRRLVAELHTRRGWEALGYGTWEECVEAEFGFGRQYSYRLIEAAEIQARLSPIGDTKTIPESQLRELARLPADRQVEAWHRAQETAPDGRLTAAHVAATVAAMAPKAPPPAAGPTRTKPSAPPTDTPPAGNRAPGEPARTPPDEPTLHAAAIAEEIEPEPGVVPAATPGDGAEPAASDLAASIIAELRAERAQAEAILDALQIELGPLPHRMARAGERLAANRSARERLHCEVATLREEVATLNRRTETATSDLPTDVLELRRLLLTPPEEPTADEARDVRAYLRRQAPSRVAAAGDSALLVWAGESLRTQDGRLRWLMAQVTLRDRQLAELQAEVTA